MFPLGHLGITIFLATLLFIPAVYAAIGVLLPDVIDKIFFNIGLLPCGRSLGHNIFLGPILAAIVFAATRNKKFAFAIWFGAYLHLLQDSYNFIPYFYPIAEYNFVCPPGVRFTLSDFEIAAEVVGLILILALVFYKSRVVALRKKIWSLIKWKH